MRKVSYLFLALAFGQSYAQKNFWTSTSENQVKKSKKSLRQISSQPSSQQLFQLDLVGLKSELSKAPLDNQASSPVLIKLPNSIGELENYNVWESPVLDPALAAQYPDLKSYVAYAVNRPEAKIRLSLSPEGLSAYGIDENGGAAIEVYTNDQQIYTHYKHADTNGRKGFKCGTSASSPIKSANVTSTQKPLARSNDSRYHTMRAVFACTGEYSSFHLSRLRIAANATDAAKRTTIMGVMQASMNAINVIYERDLSIHFNLIADNAKTIFLDTTTFDNTNDDDKATGTARINRALAVGRPAGFNANTLYDIGHVFSRITSGASGLAYTNNCDDNKADATSGSTSPFGPAFDIDFVCHEMGHQLGADHTMAGNCNRVAGYQYEPGSGTSIMAYAGVCAPNVERNSDPLFHTKSIDQIQAYVNAMTCKTTINNGNAAPVVDAGTNYTIPNGTAFVLTGSAQDANDTAASLSYSWEQIDSGAKNAAPESTDVAGPMYRVRAPKVNDPKRYLPLLSSVVAGDLTPTWEVTPSVARTLNFALTVRDNHRPNGGQTGNDQMRVTVANVGPFAVTSQAAAGISYRGNSNQTITWDVAGTTANGINTANVKITLSTDGGLTFPTVLAATEINDGSATVAMPNIVTSQARIMVEAVGNIFYAVNSTNFSIAKSTLGLDDIESSNNSLSPSPNNGAFNLKYQSKANQAIEVEVVNLLGESVYKRVFEAQAELNQNFNLNISAGIYIMNITEANYHTAKKFIVK